MKNFILLRERKEGTYIGTHENAEAAAVDAWGRDGKEMTFFVRVPIPEEASLTEINIRLQEAQLKLIEL